MTPTGSGALLTGITSDQIDFNGAYIFVQAYPTSYNLTSNTWTKITGSEVIDDTLNNFDITNQRIHITKPGIYLLQQKVSPNTLTSTVEVGAKILVNGISYGTSYNYGGTCWMNTIRRLQVGDYIEYQAYISVTDKVYTILQVMQLSN